MTFTQSNQYNIKDNAILDDDNQMLYMGKTKAQCQKVMASIESGKHALTKDNKQIYKELTIIPWPYETIDGELIQCYAVIGIPLL